MCSNPYDLRQFVRGQVGSMEGDVNRARRAAVDAPGRKDEKSPTCLAIWYRVRGTHVPPKRRI